MGKSHAAKAEIATVKIMVRMPSDMADTTGSTEQPKLRTKQRAIRAVITLLFLQGGINTAINMPYRATLKALTTPTGRILPAITPKAAPNAQHKTATNAAP